MAGYFGGVEMKTMIIAALMYRCFLIGSLMYTVGYLGWSAWWLVLLATFPTLHGAVDD